VLQWGFLNVRLQDLEPALQDFLTLIGQHPKVTAACGAKDVILYVQGLRTVKMVESKIPSEYRKVIRIVPIGRFRPAKRKR
jgi:hypothetical protein